MATEKLVSANLSIDEVLLSLSSRGELYLEGMVGGRDGLYLEGMVGGRDGLYLEGMVGGRHELYLEGKW